MPGVWSIAIINPIPKGTGTDPMVPMNYRGIAIMSCVSKLMSGILNNRLCHHYEYMDIMVDEQNDFRKGRSCRDHLYILTSIIRYRQNINRSTSVAFIDFQKSFDSVDRYLLLYMLLSYQ